MISLDPSTTTDHATAIRSLVSSAWHGLWHLALTSPWVAIAAMVPALALLVTCTRLSVRRGRPARPDPTARLPHSTA